jgi:hypothetical protein
MANAFGEKQAQTAGKYSAFVQQARPVSADPLVAADSRLVLNVQVRPSDQKR